MIFDDHRVPRRTFEEIDIEAARCRSRVPVDSNGRFDPNELLKLWGIELVIKSDAEMGDNEAYSVAAARRIFCRRAISRGLRFGDPHARQVIGHELGHMFLHRSDAPKPRKVGGNKNYNFIEEDESAEKQAWKFCRALFVTDDDLTSGESNKDIALRVGIPAEAVRLRRDEVRKAMQASVRKIVPDIAKKFLEKARLAEKEAENAKKAEARKVDAWARAAQIEGENPKAVRLAHGFRVEWSHYERRSSQVGWTIVNGEVRSLFYLGQ